METSYRPHDPGHDYHAPGIYLITLVARHRREQCQVFGVLNNDLKNPGVISSEVGRAIMEEWGLIPQRQAAHGRKVRVHGGVCMPDHFHGVLEVLEGMDVSVGEVICGFKTGCTQRWRRLLAAETTGQRPSTAAESTEAGGAEQRAEGAGQRASTAAETGTGLRGPFMAPQPGEEEGGRRPTSELPACLHNMSKRQRAEYYAAHPEVLQPLWDDNYDDTICLSDPTTGTYSQRHFSAMLRYIADNPRRAIMRRLRPQFMQRCLHVRIDGRDYAAFGNLFLLRWARKVQVFCHRRASDGRTPYETTEAYREERRLWEALVLAGGTVIVTPGISRGESLMKELCLEKGYPLIHLQKEAIGSYWKPEARRFDACATGMLLILAPWKPDSLGDVNGVPADTDYAIFHNLNQLAKEICLFDGSAVIIQR